SVHAPGIGPRELLIPAFTFTGMAVHVRPEYPAKVIVVNHADLFYLSASQAVLRRQFSFVSFQNKSACFKLG
ncbi:hypothetical protein, partial [Polaromonas sp. CG_9.11]|uniref:hypothetical protein n=1 Tax=Polaromonas sp. CG_9.11 TaxID=2787730 RepID=UPI001E32C72F